MELIIIENGSWDNKVNFIDENNVLLGYDIDQKCCEHAGYIVLDEEPTKYKTSESSETIEEINNRLKGFTFNVEYFKTIDDDSGCCDGNENVVFKATNADKSIYILLFNCHNGYYSHGFFFKTNDVIIKEDSI